MEGSDDPNAGGSTGLAILRRDGFASMGADKAGGVLATRPMSFSGKHLFVNVDNPKGELLVEILGQNGQPIPPFTMGNCKPIQANATRLEVNWDGAADLSSLSGKTVRFRFELKDGDLFSFWVSPDKSGASHGYVAAGGPGFTSSLDTVGSSLLRR